MVQTDRQTSLSPLDYHYNVEDGANSRTGSAGGRGSDGGQHDGGLTATHALATGRGRWQLQLFRSRFAAARRRSRIWPRAAPEHVLVERSNGGGDRGSFTDQVIR